jgi:hypothetical protein
VRVKLAHASSVFPRQQEDRGRRGEAEYLKHDEYKLPAMHSECSDEQAADEPHRPRAAADSNGAVLTPEVDYLRHVSRDGDRDSGSAKDCEHGLRLSV